ncbi:hypothetical protein EZV62_012385 [Acer yangbiense]|uniref:Xylose isomerase n=1 Tax=Acer yangbiense TaxID=1000413 RepID=A0A5C7HXZ3_9ROSI|nr:hypothetical protein EZV62_012385 [Acer yangbiense]
MHKETGIGWDPTKKTVDAPPEWWQSKIEMNVEYRKFRDMGISPDMMDIYNKMFKGSVVVGNCVMIPSSTILLEETVGDSEHDKQTINMENKEASQDHVLPTLELYVYVMFAEIIYIAGNRNAQERFQRSGETVSRYFDVMLDILYEMAKMMIKPLDPEFRSTPPEILSDSRYMPHFKIASPQSCPADLSTKSADSGEWEGEFFPGIPTIKYEGPTSKNPLSFKWYNAQEEILGKKMKDWMRFSVAFWHTFRGSGADPFGSATKNWPWEDGTNSLAMAKRRMRANFEFIKKLGVDLWCFHDRDIAPDAETLEETNKNLDEVVALAKKLQGTKIHPLWGTSQLFLHPRYMHGAATSSEVGVYAYAAAQVKKAMEATHYLGGENYVFWGGREGYQTLLNTDMERELDHMARFLEAAVAYKKKIGFNGTLLIEPKPQEPTKHQYDWDAATSANFLRKYGLIDEFKLNIECNHATLSGHSCHHELETARINGLLGNIDANTGDPQVGWDTDQFLTDISEATMVMLSVVRNDGSLTDLVRKRYQSFDTEIGTKIEAGKADFEMLEKKAMEWGEPKVPSAKQELAEMIFQSAL